ncbi:hypothetical protein BDW74DRAFT_147199 [Aspergillus multicolor]|uniref:uncharacterized protein n=1 Tax=Aspergillus multicolor TaxID=41759 RepID=UPI003CCC93F6
MLRTTLIESCNVQGSAIRPAADEVSGGKELLEGQMDKVVYKRRVWPAEEKKLVQHAVVPVGKMRVERVSVLSKELDHVVEHSPLKASISSSCISLPITFSICGRTRYSLARLSSIFLTRAMSLLHSLTSMAWYSAVIVLTSINTSSPQVEQKMSSWIGTRSRSAITAWPWMKSWISRRWLSSLTTRAT